jgi:hypothetical protein
MYCRFERRGSCVTAIRHRAVLGPNGRLCSTRVVNSPCGRAAFASMSKRPTSKIPSRVLFQAVEICCANINRWELSQLMMNAIDSRWLLLFRKPCHTRIHGSVSGARRSGDHDLSSHGPGSELPSARRPSAEAIADHATVSAAVIGAEAACQSGLDRVRQRAKPARFGGLFCAYRKAAFPAVSGQVVEQGRYVGRFGAGRLSSASRPSSINRRTASASRFTRCLNWKSSMRRQRLSGRETVLRTTGSDCSAIGLS